MSDQLPIKSAGIGTIEPERLTERQEELCRKLDDMYAPHNLHAKPSTMLRGAIFVSRQELKSNPDWLAQAANSLREILYPVWSKDVPSITEKKEEAFKKYGSVRIDEFAGEVDRVYGTLNDLTHHGCNPRWLPKQGKTFSTFTDADFETLLRDFENVMLESLSLQIDVHKEIDELLAIKPDQ